MLYKSAETCHPVSLPCKGTNILMFETCGASFYLWVWSVQPPIQSLYLWVRCIYMQNLLCTCSYVFYSHGCNKFLYERTFFTLADTTSILMFAMYWHARMFCTLTPSYIFYSHGFNVRAWNLFWASEAKRVLWQLMILLKFLHAVEINFYMQERFLHLLIPLLFKYSYISYSQGAMLELETCFEPV